MLDNPANQRVALEQDHGLFDQVNRFYRRP
jgi:hypothetical protein